MINVLNFLVGSIENAEYIHTGMPEYTGNPFIEALPPINTEDDVILQMMNFPFYSEKERLHAPEKRLQYVMRMLDIMQPLSRHLTLEQTISRMIRHGYKSRNPLLPSYARQIRHHSLRVRNREMAQIEKEMFAVPMPNSTGLALIGESGLGKSRTVERILSAYPQVIIHGNGIPEQIVWMKIDCPHNGSLRSLCLKFFFILDRLFGTNEGPRMVKDKSYTADVLKDVMVPRAFNHGLGLLVIDEIQNIEAQQSGGRANIINFFMEVVNELGVPLILIGTPEAEGLVSTLLRTGRRNTGMSDYPWTRMEPGDDSEWAQNLVPTLWRYQWTKHVTPYADEFAHILYDYCQGIPDLAVKLLMLSQFRAISAGIEVIDSGLIHEVAKDTFGLVKHKIDAIKRGKRDPKYPDIRIDQAYQHALEQLSQVQNAHLPKATDPINEHIDALCEFGGFAREIAKGAVKQAMNSAATAPEIRKRAFEIATELSIKPKQEKKTSRKSAPVVSISQPIVPDLIDAVKRARESGKTYYQALQENGYVVDDPIELFKLRVE